MPDPLDSSDSCFFMEATAGDGGNHTAAVWWLSPDVRVSAPVADQATINKANTVDLRVHRAVSCPGTAEAAVELWVGNPALAMAPGSNTELLTTELLNAVPSGGSQLKQFQWTPTGSGVQAAGHKCLVARCFPTDQTPDPANFWLPTSRHAVQHNIEIVTAPAGDVMKAIRISTGNPSKVRPQKVTVNVVADIKPTRFVVAAVTPLVQAVKGFKKITTTAPRAFNVEFTRFETGLNLTRLRAGTAIAMSRGVPKPQMVVNNFVKANRATGLFGQLAKPNVVANLAVQPKFFETFDFSADLTKSKPGDATIFHLTQTGQDRKPQGGLTVVVVAR